MSYECFSGEVKEIGHHSGGVNSLGIVELGEHLLVTTGGDARLKVWRGGNLVADWNVNVSIYLCSYLCPTVGRSKDPKSPKRTDATFMVLKPFSSSTKDSARTCQ